MSDDATPAGGRGFFARLLGVWWSPGETFADIAAAPRVWQPVVAVMLLNLAFTLTWVSRVDPEAFMLAQMEGTPRWERLDADAQARVLDSQTKVFPIMTPVLGVLGAIVAMMVSAGVLHLVFRFVYASVARFPASLSITAWSFLAVGAVTIPLMLVLMGLKGDWNVNPGDVLAANPTLFLDRGDTPAPLWALASRFDLFAFWTIALLASGFAVASRRGFSAALPAVVLPWAVFVAVSTGLAALF